MKNEGKQKIWYFPKHMFLFCSFYENSLILIGKPVLWYIFRKIFFVLVILRKSIDFIWETEILVFICFCF